jgi:hypothetical protein
MSKLVTGVAVGTAGGTILNRVLIKLSTDKWSAVGLLVAEVVVMLLPMLKKRINSLQTASSGAFDKELVMEVGHWLLVLSA